MKLHTTMPSGFDYADRHQVFEYLETGFVHGAAKVAQVGRDGVEVDLVVRLRPPRTVEEVRSPLGRRYMVRLGSGALALEKYVAEYDRGWAASRTNRSQEFGSGYSSDAYDDGYLDAAAGRTKWHITYCADHDTCGEG